MQVVVTQPQPVAAGANFDYVIDVNNEGPDDAANAQLTFPLAAGTTFQSENVPASWTCNAIAPGAMAPTVTCTSPDFAPGTAAFTITASTPPTASGTFSTIATVSSTTPDPHNSDNTFPIDVLVQPSDDFSAALAAAPNPVNAGSNVTWTMTATNNGPSAAVDATVDMPLPVETTFVSVSAPPNWSCTSPSVGANGTVSCSLSGSMNPATSATFVVVSRVVSSTPSGTPISMTATVSSTNDSVPANDFATASVQSAVFYDVGIAKTGMRIQNIDAQNELDKYTIVVTNSGPSDAPVVTMTDVLAAPLSFDQLSPPVGWICSILAPSHTGTISCSIPSMISGSTSTFSLFVFNRGAAGTTVSNTAVVASSPQDSNASNNSSTATMVMPSPPNVTATKSIGGGAVHPEGSVVTYTIVLSNSGKLAQPDNPGNELTDVLPSSLTLVSAAANSGAAVANLGTNTVTWNGSIAGGGSVTITIQALVKNGTKGSTISNSATVSYDFHASGTNDATRTSDDPSTAAPSDPTSFLVAGSVPALSMTMLILLAAALAAVSLIVMRK